MSNASESNEQWVKARQEGVTVTYEPEYARFRISTHLGNGVHRAIGYGDTRDLAYADARRRLEPKPDAEASYEMSVCKNCDAPIWKSQSGRWVHEGDRNSLVCFPEKIDTPSGQPKPDAAGEAKGALIEAGERLANELQFVRDCLRADGHYCGNPQSLLDAWTIAVHSAPRNPDLAAAAKEMADALDQVQIEDLHMLSSETAEQISAALARYRAL